MRLAILSDVHGNLDALEAVLEDIESFNVDSRICLGDVVGYGAEPNACVDRIRDACDVVLVGNHDRTAIGMEDSENFNAFAREAILWTAAKLNPGSIEFLVDCPLTTELDAAVFAHATPFRPEEWRYIFTPVDGRIELALTPARLCFVGHSHHAFVCSESGDATLLGFGEVRIEQSDRYLINAGSVGQPRDGDPRAAFLIWDQDTCEIQVRRTNYDIASAQEKIRNARLPGFLADRLALGR